MWIKSNSCFEWFLCFVLFGKVVSVLLYYLYSGNARVEIVTYFSFSCVLDTNHRMLAQLHA